MNAAERITHITADSIAAAVAAGHRDVLAIARHLGVPHTSYTLRARIKHCVDQGILGVDHIAPDGTKFFTRAN